MGKSSNSQWIELELPTPSMVGRFALWCGGRLILSGILLGCHTVKGLSRLTHHIAEMLEKSTLKLLGVWDYMPLMGVAVSQTIEAEIKPSEHITPTTDITSLISGKHIIIVGDTGTGKSTLAQYLAYLISGKVIVYDADASPDEWVGLEVVGRGGDLEAIAHSMKSDLDDLEFRLQLRGNKGDSALAGLETITIAEEFPLLADEIDTAREWMMKHARRGRKPKRFIILITQSDNAKTLDIEGEGDVRNNFRYFRLGKYAVTHAKKLGDKSLLAWLQQQSHPCLVDDIPVRLPSLSEMRAVTPRVLLQPVSTQSVTLETPTEQELQLLKQATEPGDEALWKSVKALLDEGKSESWIIKSVLGYEGRNYPAGKEILEAMKGRFGGGK